MSPSSNPSLPPTSSEAGSGGAPPVNTGGASGMSTGGSPSAEGGGPASLGGASGEGGANAGGAGQAGMSGSSSAGAAGSAGEGGTGGALNEPYNPCPAAGEPCRIVPFGDSITDGFNVPGGYRIELFQLALDAGQSIEFFGSSENGPTEVDNMPFPRRHEGHSGYTIHDAPGAGRVGISPLVQTVLDFEPDIILLKIGTNDLHQNVDVANAPTRLAELVDSILDQDDHVLLVVAQIVPSRLADLNDRVEAYNAAIPGIVEERAAQGKHIAIADMESAFLADSNYQSSLLADDLHPSTAGYALLGQTYYGVIGELLR